MAPPLPHVMVAAKASAFGEATLPLLVNVRNIGITGRQAESTLHECGITLNLNSLPFDPNGLWYTSGLRIETAAVSTLGMGKAEIEELVAVIALVLNHTRPDRHLAVRIPPR